MICVLVVVALLALSAYTFVELMLTEQAATDFHGRSIKARLFAESGIAFAQSTLNQRRQWNADTVFARYDSERFEEKFIGPEGQGSFTVFAPSDGEAVQYEVLDLSSRLNVNALAMSRDGSARHALMQLPQMTVDVADAVLDWIDVDEIPRDYGAESRYYESLSSGYRCRNGPIASIDELLRVRGITPALLYGADRNHNGRIDPHEDEQGSRSGIRDDTDDSNNAGWTQWLTAISGERNLRRNGRTRINLNHPSLTDLFDDLAAEFGTDTAKFVVAYRMYGPFPACEEIRPQAPTANHEQPTESERPQTDQKAIEPEQRAGMILNSGPRYIIRSVFDLVGIQVGYVDETGRLLTSPWSLDGGQLNDDFFEFEDAVSTTSAKFIPGRINIFQADVPVLSGIPGFTPELASRIVARRKALESGMEEGHQATGRLLERGMVDLKTMQKVAPFVTSRGDIVMGQVIGHFVDRAPPYCRLEFIIKMSQHGSRLIQYRDLSEFGPGWPSSAMN